jgi:hypothetical protein
VEAEGKGEGDGWDRKWVGQEMMEAGAVFEY